MFHHSTLDESVFLAFRQSLCGMVFSALSETNSSLQITATSVLTSLAQQTGEIHLTLKCIAYNTVGVCRKYALYKKLLIIIIIVIHFVSGLLLDSDIELAVDHLNRLLLTEEDDRVRSAYHRHTVLFLVNHCICLLLSLSFLSTHTVDCVVY